MKFLRTARCIRAVALALFAANALAQEQWIGDERGCKVFNPLPKANQAIRWSGACENGFAQGQGTLEWFLNGAPNGTNSGHFHDGKQTGRGTHLAANGARYEGEYVNSRAHGVGTITMRNGFRYEGDFLEGEFSGNGALTTPDGIRRRGQFVAGMFTYGTINWPNGDSYTGQFSDNKRTQGVYNFANGDRYEGGFLDGKFHGQGVFTRANGEKRSGIFANGKLVGSGASSSPTAPPAEPQPLSAFKVEFTPAGPERYPATNASEVERFKTISRSSAGPDKVSDEEKPSRPYVLVGKLHFPLAWHYLESGVSWCPAEEGLIAANVRAVGGDAVLLCEVTEHTRWLTFNSPAAAIVSYREITLQVIRYTDR